MQVTIACAERGLLLHRVRTELRTMIRAYQKLYESSAAFGMRKALQAEQQRNEMDERAETLTDSNKQLEQEVKVMERYLEKTAQDARERMEQVRRRWRRLQSSNVVARAASEARTRLVACVLRKNRGTE